ncbi:MAG: 2-oxo-4-hydroxy-4-carboxy-5-ureidoimidazoline decarboxylase [Bacteroidota bacterium]|nr:2-oxo-4-hydroxy-4-carboxy-5-ureidoimidazoline decarboxylase [Ferruginibacter sp.]
MTIHELNTLPTEELRQALYNCCGSTTWVNKMISLLPMEELVELMDFAEEQWFSCSEADWREAFSQHPRIGDTASLNNKFPSTAQWAGAEQQGVNVARQQTLKLLEEGNKTYEEKFGYIFIVSASGKSADEMLHSLNARLQNNAAEELTIAAEEQNKITLLRLQKLMQ